MVNEAKSQNRIDATVRFWDFGYSAHRNLADKTGISGQPYCVPLREPPPVQKLLHSWLLLYIGGLVSMAYQAQDKWLKVIGQTFYLSTIIIQYVFLL